MAKKKNVASSRSSAPGSVPGHAPAVPHGEVGGLSPTEAHRLHHPLTSQITLASQAASEIRGQDYAQDFGKHAPDAATLASDLETAQGWSAERVNAEAWLAYVKKHEELSWDETLVSLATLKDPFGVALAADATIAQRYPATTALLAARSGAASRGVATRQAKRAAPAKAAVK